MFDKSLSNQIYLIEKVAADPKLKKQTLTLEDNVTKCSSGNVLLVMLTCVKALILFILSFFPSS